jgi:hypothetical protein
MIEKEAHRPPPLEDTVSKSEYERLLNQGRKAGLNTRELNSALTGRAAGEGDVSGRPDSNGFIWVIDERGNLVCQPMNEGRQN